MSEEIDSRAVPKETRLEWNVLIELFCDEDILKNSIEQVKDSASVNDYEIIDLADNY
jgi:hypothetical protein